MTTRSNASRQLITFWTTLTGICVFVVALLAIYQTTRFDAEEEITLRQLYAMKGLVDLQRDLLEMSATSSDSSMPASSSSSLEQARVAPQSAARLPVASMDSLLNELRMHADVLLGVLGKHRNEETKRVRALVLFSFALTVLGGIVVGYQTRREVRRRGKSEEEARATLKLVDERVQQRTAELVKANARLEEAHQMKDRFLATVSHELRTPLNAIVGWVAVLKTGRTSAADVERAVDSIERNVHRQTELVNALLDASQLLQGRLQLSMTVLDLRRVVETAVAATATAARDKGVHIQAAFDPQPLTIRGDEWRLRQIVTHLLSNAVKFTPGGGRVDVTLTVDAGSVVLRVIDTGEGVPPDYLPRLFDAFLQGHTRSKRTGLGLSLAIVRQLVELHGGTIAAESAGEGQGATLTVRLPCLNEQCD